MWPLPIPDYSARDTYRTCISNARQDKREILDQYEQSVVEAAEHFDTACRRVSLHILESSAFGPPQSPEANVHAKELEGVYTRRMVDESGPGRPIYDALRAAAPYGRCPLCGQGRVST